MYVSQLEMPCPLFALISLCLCAGNSQWPEAFCFGLSVRPSIRPIPVKAISEECLDYKYSVGFKNELIRFWWSNVTVASQSMSRFFLNVKS